MNKKMAADSLCYAMSMTTDRRVPHLEPSVRFLAITNISVRHVKPQRRH